jgi:hypothetical protein
MSNNDPLLILKDNEAASGEPGLFTELKKAVVKEPDVTVKELEAWGHVAASIGGVPMFPKAAG